MRVSTIISIAAFALVAACAGQTSRKELAEMSGKQMYGRMCASCHGVSGKGNGPMTPLLKIDVPDLTGIAHRHGGEFPAEYVRRTIDGRFEKPAHGLPYMPVWGWKFDETEVSHDPKEPARVDSPTERLVEQLRSMQEN